MYSNAGPARSRVTDRAGWVRANVASFQRLLRPLGDTFGDRLASGPFAPMARAAAGAEVGALLGWMSTRVLGQYDLLLVEDEEPDDQDLVYYVGPNVLALEKRFGFPPEEFRLWLALHEVTHRAQFTGVPWMRAHFLGLVERRARVRRPRPDAAPARAAPGGRRRPGRPQPLRRRRAGPAAGHARAGGRARPDRRADEPARGPRRRDDGSRRRRRHPERRAVRPRAAGATPLGQPRHPPAPADPRARGKLAQYEQGERFIAAVEREGGPALLNSAFEAPSMLPTLSEIRAPERWIERVTSRATV